VSARACLPAVLVLAFLGCALSACGGDGAARPTATATHLTATATTQPSASPSPTAAQDTPAAPTATAVPPPTSLPPGGSATVVRRVEGAGRVAVLTFDAGSDTGYTALILDTLRANGITAGFGVTGEWAQRNPDLMRRIVRDGHDLINHTYNHPSFTGLSTGLQPLTQAQRWAQLDQTEEIARGLTGATTKPYFRPPFGDYDASVNDDVYARGYAYNIMWTVDSGGWRGIPAQEIVGRCLSQAEPGAVYVFHVGSASQDGPALQAVIDGLRAQGYSFAPLSALLP
jgi:peptidoglycan/xylan/chitin deacetylase (PgdA/CDA1 family)